MRFIGSGKPASGDDARAELERLTARFDVDGFGVLAIELVADCRFIGRAGFYVWDTETWTSGHTRAELGERGQVELGWALVRDAWGRGYATEAAIALRNLALTDLSVSNLVSLIHPANRRSLAVAARLGAVFVREIRTARWGPALMYRHRLSTSAE